MSMSIWCVVMCLLSMKVRMQMTCTLVKGHSWLKLVLTLVYLGRIMAATHPSFCGEWWPTLGKIRQWSRVEGVSRCRATFSGFCFFIWTFNCQFYDAKTSQTSKFASCAISGWGFVRLLVWYRIPRSRQRGQSEFRVTKQWIFNFFFGGRCMLFECYLILF